MSKHIFDYKNNIFTKIINREIPSTFILENDSFIAIKDINPQANIHILLIPKNNYVNYFDFIKNGKEAEKYAFFDIYEKLIEMYNIQENHQVKINNGKESGQEVFHTHIHILSNKKL